MGRPSSSTSSVHFGRGVAAERGRAALRIADPHAAEHDVRLIELERPEAAVAAHELGDEAVDRRPQDLLGGVVLRQAAALGHHGHAVAQHDRLVHVVGDEHDRLVEAVLQLDHLALQIGAHERIHRGEGLVHEQDRRVGGQCAGHAHALLLSSRQLRG